jgi:hypothetical protein
MEHPSFLACSESFLDLVGGPGLVESAASTQHELAGHLRSKLQF